jgi:hypothetical protein
MAGLEERLSKLESILHRLFCCDTNQFTGPEGPQGPQGDPGTPGLQGPTGAQGAVGPAGLNWQGEWAPCVVYQENDAVGWNGASYYVTCPTSDSAPCYAYIVTGTGSFEYTGCSGFDLTVVGAILPQLVCSINPIPFTVAGLTFTPATAGEECPSTACVPPDLNPCFALLASQGAVGPQGPAGIAGVGVNGNDGSNSGRWKFRGIPGSPGDPGSTYFMTNDIDLDDVDTLYVSFADINSTDYQDWWTALNDFGNDYPGSLFFIQITEVGSNNIIGIYQIDNKVFPINITLYPGYIVIGLDPVYVSNSVFTVNKDYTISWSIHGGVNGGNAPKTEGIVTPVLQPGPYPTLVYDYNELNPQPSTPAGTFYHAILPAPLFRGQTLVVRALGTNLDYATSPGIISHDGSSIINLNTALTNSFTLHNQACMRFTWSGTYWVAEDIQGYETMFNDFKTLQTLYNIIETVVDGSTSYPTQVYLNAAYPPTSSPRGVKVYCPSIPGGPRVFTKITDPTIGSPSQWASYPYTVVT